MLKPSELLLSCLGTHSLGTWLPAALVLTLEERVMRVCHFLSSWLYFLIFLKLVPPSDVTSKAEVILSLHHPWWSRKSVPSQSPPSQSLKLCVFSSLQRPQLLSSQSSRSWVIRLPLRSERDIRPSAGCGVCSKGRL